MNTSPSRQKISTLARWVGNTIGEKQVLESPTSNGMGTEIPEQLFGEATRAQHKETDWAIDNRGDNRRKEYLD